MRKFLFFILLATVAVPALAAPDALGRDGDRRAARVEQNESDEGEKPARPQRAERAPRPEAVEQAAPVARVERAQRNQQADVVTADQPQRRVRDGAERSNRSSGRNSGEYSRRQQDTTDGSSRHSSEYSRERDRDRQYSGETRPTGGDRSRTNWGERSSDGQTSPTTRPTTTRHWDGDRDGRRRWDGDRDGRRRWSGDWRRDNRYDWRRHRSRYSSLFRLGRYYDPYRYGYRRFSIGLTLGSGYYSNSNYWLNDPWQYRLPPAYGPYRWIRYYDDALLVNIYSGEVVDVIYGFFW